MALEPVVHVQGNEQPPVLLVDGYNVLMHWQKTFPEDEIAQAFLEAARLKLEEDLITYSQRRQVKVVVVYDAMQRAADPVHVDIRTSVRWASLGNLENLVLLTG